jgi:predicted metalloprotease with PDZ domain
MIKHNFHKIYFCARLFAAAIFVVLLSAPSFAQAVEVKISVSATNSRVHVEGKFTEKQTQFHFEDSYADVTGISARISKVVLRANDGREIAPTKIIAGEFETGESISQFSYDVNLAPMQNLTSAAHASWLTSERGILMLNDLLPVTQNSAPRSALVRLSIPSGWKIETNEKSSGADSFEIDDAAKAIFFIGRDLREIELKESGTEIKIALAGEWLFSDREAADFVSSIFASYQKLFGGAPAKNLQIVVAPFPQAAGTDRWRAETRGSTIVILSGSMPFKTLAVQRLHEQLRHEIFHLWIPNGLALTGNYSWFYESFAIYEALRTGVELNQIRFEDFLSTIGRAAYIAGFAPAKVSLVEASRLRWVADSNQVEARGILVAFLCDIALLDAGGKRSLADVIRKVYLRHRIPAAAQDGNEAVLEILKESRELREIISRRVELAETPEIESYLNKAGIIVNASEAETKLSVTEKPNREQRALLKKLGYDNWKKLAK